VLLGVPCLSRVNACGRFPATPPAAAEAPAAEAPAAASALAEGVGAPGGGPDSTLGVAAERHD
jgi:hypothetical protein